MISFTPMIMSAKKHMYIYTMDTFNTLLDGARTTENTGTAELSDAVLHTGQMCKFNGIDQYCATDYYPKADIKTFMLTMRMDKNGHY